MSSKNESEKTRSSGEEKTQTEFSNQKENPVPKMMRVYIYVSDNACSILSEIKQMKIELVMFLYMFANMMIMVTLTSLIMEKVCLVHLGESEDVCSNLKDNLKTKTKVEKQASNYSVGISLVQMIPSSILACFIGAWSDRYSRKIPLIMALIGTTINGLGSTLLAAVFYSRAEFLFIPSTFAGISGGMVTVMTVLYSFASDTTTFGKRTIKYAFLEFAFGLAMPLGQLAGGWLFQWFGYIPVFLVSTCCHIFSLVFVICVLQETKGLDNKDSWIVKLRNLWSVQPVLESIRATIKPRPNKGRLQILLLILAMSLAVLSYASTGNINFIYCHHLYDWGNTKFSTISSIFSVIGTAGVMISVPIFRRYKTEDPILGIVGSSSLLIKNVAMGLAHKEEFYLLANLFGLLSGLATLAGRSRISKVTSKDDIGKVFSFVTTAESILPILSTVVATQIFTATIDFYPGLVYLGLGGILILPLVIFSWISRLPIINYEQMHNESEDKVLSGDPCMETETAQSSNVEDGNELELKSNV
ncbi:solute carrier family 46 member 3-like [Argiope bruennichi]|uniref:solute carrier family 46 member 3-like n=1 Tax=Argiope bruennichi TaxID=94029 RepID=UPI0024940C83|nr:solute carrier family 46 member 3-like [Argiope bruennichi]XP_055938612.1 solute carrier family 46 member 3-like [Argiope bruennichi]